jgi:hypothetical protein
MGTKLPLRTSCAHEEGALTSLRADDAGRRGRDVRGPLPRAEVRGRLKPGFALALKGRAGTVGGSGSPAGVVPRSWSWSLMPPCLFGQSKCVRLIRRPALPRRRTPRCYIRMPIVRPVHRLLDAIARPRDRYGSAAARIGAPNEGESQGSDAHFPACRAAFQRAYASGRQRAQGR